ncbi:hypothetical protein LTR17_005620 [Elasticomyces elasticus]|nr:hypothetical protein LTR17_005620 [Elasticomyces elasticus]
MQTPESNELTSKMSARVEMTEVTETTGTDGADKAEAKNPESQIIEIIKNMKLAGPLPPPNGLRSMANMLETIYQGVKHPNNCCGQCGQDEKAEGPKLLVCGRCKAMRYCDKECQRTHWKAHKGFCRAPNAEGSSMRGFDDLIAAAEAYCDAQGLPKKRD